MTLQWLFYHSYTTCYLNCLSCLQVSVTLNFPQASDTEAKCPPFLSAHILSFLHLLLTGHFIEALCMNPFLMISLPYATLAVLGKWYNINGVFNRLNRFIYSRKVLLVYIILFFIWWGIRIVFGI